MTSIMCIAPSHTGTLSSLSMMASQIANITAPQIVGFFREQVRLLILKIQNFYLATVHPVSVSASCPTSASANVLIKRKCEIFQANKIYRRCCVVSELKLKLSQFTGNVERVAQNTPRCCRFQLRFSYCLPFIWIRLLNTK